MMRLIAGASCLALYLPLMLAGCGWDTGVSQADSGNAALPPAGSVARGTIAAHAVLAGPGQKATPAVLRRGAERYAIFCAPCHGTDGSGDSQMVRRGFPRPPPLDAERLATEPPDHIVMIITRGVGAMYPLEERVPPADRWAIAYHVRELQRRARERAP